MRVAVVTPELHRSGGTERSLCEQVLRWRTEFDLHVVTQRVDGVDLTAEELVRVRRVPGPHLVGYIWWMLANRFARRTLSSHSGVDVTMSPGVNALDADAIGVHIIFAKYWDHVGGTRAGRSSATLLRVVHRILFLALFRALERRVYEGPALLWTMSERDAREVEERFDRPADSVAAVPHGVDTDSFHPKHRVSRRSTARLKLGLEEDDRLLLLVGNDLVTKGADHALAALALLPSWMKLAVAGGFVADELNVMADRSGVRDRVLILPHVDDPIEYYAAADVLVAPSREDSFHLPAMEAMACGLPVIVSNQAGVSELVADGRDAVVIDDPANADGLAAAVARVLGRPELAESLAENGRSLAERFSWEENATRTAALLDREARTPRLLVLASDPGGTGGIQRSTRLLLTGLCELYGSDRVGTVALRQQGDAPVPGRLLRRGQPIKRRRQRVSFIARARYALAAVSTARRWRRRLAIFACHPHLAPVAWACGLVSGAPYAVWCHGVESWGPMPALVARGLRAADIVFAPSEFTARRVEEVAGLRPGSVRVVPHGVFKRDAETEPPTRKEHPPVVLCVARLTRENRYKGIDTLLYAWPRVLEKVEATLLIVGDGPDTSRLQRIAGALDLDGSVRFAGRVTDEELADAYASSSVFAMPGRHRLEPRPEGEGFGLVYVEAGAAGLPVIAGDGGGSEETVEEGGSGLLLDARDHRVVADALLRLLTDPVLARRLGERGRELADGRFSYETFRANVADLVNEMGPRGLL